MDFGPAENLVPVLEQELAGESCATENTVHCLPSAFRANVLASKAKAKPPGPGRGRARKSNAATDVEMASVGADADKDDDEQGIIEIDGDA